MQPAIRQLMVDWNGTVVADRARALDATNTALRWLGIEPITGSVFSQSFTLPLPQFFRRLGVPPGALAEAERIWNDTSIGRPAQLAPGAVLLLGACRRRQIPVGVITAADPALVGADLARLGIRHLITWVAGRVPDKQAELARTTTPACPAAYIGDTADDVEQARRADVMAIALTGGYHSRAQLETARPDLIIDDLREILPFLYARTSPEAREAGPALP